MSMLITYCQTLAELEAAVLSWQNEDTHSKHRTSTKKAEKEKHKDKDKDYHREHPKEGGAIFGLFKRCKVGCLTIIVLYLH